MLIWTVPMALLLLVPAGLVPGGTWIWPHGLALMAGLALIGLVGNLVLTLNRPTHFRVRQQSVVAARGRRQPWIDAAGSVGLLVFGAAWLAFIPLDVFRLHLLPAPGPWATAAGGLAALIGATLTPLAVWENRLATPNVQDQTDLGQRVVDTGVYRLVRHPLYLGNLLLYLGASVWLGSYAAAVGVIVLLLATVARIAIEEKDLRARLPAYADYARRVRGRLIPFLL
jgi:protein-S-isoprenylcysteine O-methyltransferase Ste14